MGIPSGVVTDILGLDDDKMQQIATDLGFSETIFLSWFEGVMPKARIFTPTVEIPFAGHPLVGAAWILINLGPIDPGGIECSIGTVRIRQVDGVTWIDGAGDQPVRAVSPDLGPGAGPVDIAEVLMPTPYLLVQVGTPEEVAAMTPSMVAGFGDVYVWAWDGGRRICPVPFLRPRFRHHRGSRRRAVLLLLWLRGCATSDANAGISSSIRARRSGIHPGSTLCGTRTEPRSEAPWLATRSASSSSSLRPVATASAPASSANLGPGFDVLALALELRCTVDASPTTVWSVRHVGPEYPSGHFDSVLEAARRAVGEDRPLSLVVDNRIPIGRGLGSSAAAAVAGAAAAWRAVGEEAHDRAVFDLAVDMEDHPDNAAAAVYGGLVLCTPNGEVHRLPIYPGLIPILAVPDRALATSDARAALPDAVPMDVAVRSLGRLAALVERPDARRRGAPG